MLKKEAKLKSKKSQASTEYLLVIGFITLAIIVLLGIALSYSGAIRDSIRLHQLKTFSDKVLSTSESVFYAGEPSKATIDVFLPDGVKSIEIMENSLFFTVQTDTGLMKSAFSSKVPIIGSITISQGIKKVQILAQENSVLISG